MLLEKAGDLRFLHAGRYRVLADGMVRITRGALEMIVNTANFGPTPAQQVDAKTAEVEESQRQY